MEAQIHRLTQLAETFKFESEAQRKGFLAFLLWLRRVPSVETMGAGYLLPLLALYQMQKDHESSEWFIRVIGDQVHNLRMEIQDLRTQLSQ